jgi:hypothetical protein
LIFRVPGNATFRCNVFFVPPKANEAYRYALKRECVGIGCKQVQECP